MLYALSNWMYPLCFTQLSTLFHTYASPLCFTRVTGVCCEDNDLFICDKSRTHILGDLEKTWEMKIQSEI